MSGRTRTKPSSRAKSASRPHAEHPAMLGRVGWLAALAVWVFIIASLLGYNPADAPGHAVSPRSETIVNWCGPVGATIAHHLLSTLGWGVWLLLVGLGVALVRFVIGHRVTQPGVRAVGLTLTALSISGIQALLIPHAGVLPEGGGGLVAIAGVGRLQESFSTLGTFIWIMLALLIGAVVAFDKLLLAAPGAAWRVAAPAGAAVWSHTVGLAQRAAGAARERRIRHNDLDDDDRLQRRARDERKKAIRVAKPVVVEAEDDDEEAEEETPRRKRTKPRVVAKLAAAKPGPAAQDVEEEDEEEEDELPGAPQVFDPEALREKIARLPVRFAGSSRQVATEADLESIQSQGEMEGYQFPAIDLLEDPEESYSERMEEFVRDQARALEEALRVYRINGEVVGIDSGPVITLYEVRLAPGTKVSALSAVSSDIARALKAINIRIVPNMVGRDTVGVEVPNAHKEKVRLKELMSKSEGEVSKMRLPMYLGKDASGEPLIDDLASLPHLLIAGTTGSGKSVCMNTIIMSFLYTKKPSELKLVLIDPKMVELSMFRDIPHLMCPVVTEMSKAAAILEWAVLKMDERYELLAEAGVRDIAGYNALEWEELKERMNPQSEAEEARIPRKLPYIVFMIDELADLMMTHKEVEGAIVRVAQKARAVGMHLILATQRPQANVVTGLIKSNMPGRICFKVASGMDSRIVMDQKGGELLLGQGDMLLLSPRSHKLMRAQGTLVEDREARRVVRFLRDVAAPSFERQLVQLRSPGMEEDHDGLANAQEDPLFDKAVEIVLETKRGSVSLLQRRLAIGYTRASRLIDLMGAAGIIGEHKGTVAREVAITREEWEAMKEQAAADAAAREEGEGGGEPGVQRSLFAEPKVAVAAATATKAPEAAPFAPTGEYIEEEDLETDEDEEDEEYDDEDEEDEEEVEEDEEYEDDEEDDEEEADEDEEELEEDEEEDDEEEADEELEEGEEWEEEDEEGDEDEDEEEDEDDGEEDADGWEWEEEEDDDEPKASSKKGRGA